MYWYQFAAVAAIIGILIWTHWAAVQWGGSQRKRMLKQVHKKRENGSVNDFIIRPAEDGYMEIMITKKQYKKLRGEPLLGLVEGSKQSMGFRLGIL